MCSGITSREPELGLQEHTKSLLRNILPVRCLNEAAQTLRRHVNERPSGLGPNGPANRSFECPLFEEDRLYTTGQRCYRSVLGTDDIL
jgi:hypothetical protein